MMSEIVVPRSMREQAATLHGLISDLGNAIERPTADTNWTLDALTHLEHNINLFRLALEHEASTERLTSEQRQGLACVGCGRKFTPEFEGVRVQVTHVQLPAARLRRCFPVCEVPWPTN